MHGGGRTGHGCAAVDPRREMYTYTSMPEETKIVRELIRHEPMILPVVHIMFSCLYRHARPGIRSLRTHSILMALSIAVESGGSAQQRALRR